jgi:hypothetical protein
LPNGRRATFFNLWAGKSRNRSRYYAQLREDLRRVFALLDKGEITAQVARTFPLTEAAEALRYAESGNAAGKVVLIPATRAPAERTVSKPLPVLRGAGLSHARSLPTWNDGHATGVDRWTLLGPDGATRYEPNKDGAPRKLLPGFLSKPPSVTLSELHDKRTPPLRDGQAMPARGRAEAARVLVGKRRPG